MKLDSGGITKLQKSFWTLGDLRKRSQIWLGWKYMSASCMKTDSVSGRVRDVVGYLTVSEDVSR